MRKPKIAGNYILREAAKPLDILTKPDSLIWLIRARELILSSRFGKTYPYTAHRVVTRTCPAVDRLHDAFVAAGYEGAILRAPDAPYATGARSAALLKYKRFDDAEFEIVGATSARGTDAGCVVWECATETGQTFDVVPAWSDDERCEAFANAWFLIRKMLTVRFSWRTAASVPRCASGIAVRAAKALPGTAEQLEYYFKPRSAHVIVEGSWR